VDRLANRLLMVLSELENMMQSLVYMMSMQFD